MGDMGDLYNELKDERRARRQRLGVECPYCPANRNPTILLPGQTCRVDGYKDQRDPKTVK